MTAFDTVMRTTVDVYSSPTVGRIQANRTLLEASRLAPPADLTALDRLKEETDTLQSQLLDDARVARKQYYSIAHSYLAGDPGALGLPAGASPRLD